MDKFGICLQTLIPIRSQPAESAEMATQILFGESYKVLQETERWMKVELTNDGYQGWIDIKLFHAVNQDYLQKNKRITHSPLTVISKNKMPFTIVSGSEVPANCHSFSVGSFNFTDLIDEQAISQNASSLIAIAQSFYNAPYLWGGKTSLGIDCSGLTQICYKSIDIQLPRDASQQMEQGKTIGFINEAVPGDLAFFDNEEGNITHVGLLISASDIIHASGSVRIDKIDHQGIFDREMNQYTHKLRIIKRIINLQ